ncbi:transposase [Rubrivirga sp.]|uniref:transposase n=1 Tax=Rubrivirga sp. TaxID=1885344 RepID=UPI003C72E225
MPRHRPAYPPEFREQIVALHRSGRSVVDLAREFEPTEHTTRDWIAKADPSSFTATDSDRDELRRLRKEVKRLQQERDILAKAAAWFARETGSVPSGPSSS